VYRTFGPDGDGLKIMNIETNAVAMLTKGYDNFPLWSPRGDLIMFSRQVEGDYEIYTIKPDGTGLQRLTTDTLGPLGTTEAGDFGARLPNWTRDGRIVFTRNAAPSEAVMQLWVMDRDGSNATRLDPSDAATLTAIGCVSCPYPATDLDVFPGIPSIAIWVPGK